MLKSFARKLRIVVAALAAWGVLWSNLFMAPAMASLSAGGEETEGAASPICQESSSREQGRAFGECYDLRRNRRSRCEPQCIPYARCRSGIDTCRTGHENGPLTWFNCEKSQGKTTAEPRSGSLMVLAANNRHNMGTGHIIYVEKIVAETDGTYRLSLSHTNFDRRCSLEEKVSAVYHRDTRTVDFVSGAWKVWGKGLKVAGFIHGNPG